MNTNYKRIVRRTTCVVAIFFGALACALSSYASQLSLESYGSSRTTPFGSLVYNNTLDVSLNNTVPGTLKEGGYWHDDVYLPAMTTLKASGSELSSLTSFKVKASNTAGAPTNAYEDPGNYGLLVIGDGNGTLKWNMSGFDSGRAGFGAMVQVGTGITSTNRGQSVDVTLTGTNTFGSYTTFGGRGVHGGDATVTFASGKASFSNGSEVNFGGSTFNGTGGTGNVYFNGGTVEFMHQNAYFGGNAKQGTGGKAYVEFNGANTTFGQRAIFGGVGFLNAGYSEVDFNGGNTLFTYKESSESNYRGVYFSAMAYHEPNYGGVTGKPYYFGPTSGTTVTFNDGKTTFNVLTLFGGSYNLDRIGGGDKDRTWGGDINVYFNGGVNRFVETTMFLDRVADYGYYRWEGGTYFGGPASNVYVKFNGGDTAFIGASYDSHNAETKAYIEALARAENNKYTMFNSYNYADEVQFGGNNLQVGESIYVNGQFVTLTDDNIKNYNTTAHTTVDIYCGRVYFENVRATFGGRVGDYLRYDSYVYPDEWPNGITKDFFQDDPRFDIDGECIRHENKFDDLSTATLNLYDGAELRIGADALLIGLTKGTEMNGYAGKIYYDFKFGDTNGSITNLDVGTIYFRDIDLPGSKVDISIEQVQRLTEGSYLSDIALMTTPNGHISFGRDIGEVNRFYSVDVVPTVQGDNSMYSLSVKVKRQLGFYSTTENGVEASIGNADRNRRNLNDIIYHHSESHPEVANAVKEILKRSNNAIEEAANFDLLGGAIYSSMVHVQVQRIHTLNNILAQQIYAEDAGRYCYGCNCARGMCYDSCQTGCGYSCGGYSCGDVNCGSNGGGMQGQVMYDETGNPYPVYNQAFNAYCAPRFTLWARAYGFNGDVDNRKGFSGYDSESFGGIFGIQWRCWENGRFGLYYAYGESKINSDEATMGWAKIDSKDHTFGIYGKWEDPCHCGYHLLNANYSWSGNESQRVFNTDSCTWQGVYDGDYDSHMASVFFEKGWDYCFWQRWTINPYMNAQWVHYSADNFIEGGGYNKNSGEGLALDIDNLRYNSLRTALGARFSLRALMMHPCHDLRFTTNIAWVHEWLDPQASMNSMVYHATNLPKWRMYGNGGGISWVNWGIGLNYTFRDRVTFGINYDLFANEYTAIHAGAAAVSIAW